MKEETGYIGEKPTDPELTKLKGFFESPILFNDPWKSSETTNLVTLEINFKSNENKNP